MRRTIQIVGFATVLLFSLSGYGQQRKNKFEIALGVNAVDVYLNNGYGLNARAEESFISDIFTANDWNIGSKARDTYTDEGNKETALPPISLRAAYYFSDQLALGLHFSANYLDIIDLCYNAVGLPDMDFTNFEGFLRFNPLQDTKIQPYAQLALGKSWVGERSNLHAGLDLGATLWLSDQVGLGYTAGVRTMFGTDLSEYLQHNLELVVRLGLPRKVAQPDFITYPLPQPINFELNPITLKAPYIKEYLRTSPIFEFGRPVFFDYKSASINTEIAQQILIDVANDINHYALKNIYVIGHTDLQGNSEYNLDLSINRSLAVTKYLVSNGASVQGFVVGAVGESQPLEIATNEMHHARNRRVFIDDTPPIKGFKIGEYSFNRMSIRNTLNALNLVQKQLELHPEMRIRLTGFPPSSNASLQQLEEALRTAQRFAKTLVWEGVNPEIIEVFGYGSIYTLEEIMLTIELYSN
jgi:outer membrane protein OmpA-like peptidoglycan-associated protein